MSASSPARPMILAPCAPQGAPPRPMVSLPTAERLLQHALQIAPDDPQTLAALGNIYRRQGRDSKALPLLRQAEARLQQQLTGGPKAFRAAASAPALP